MTWLTQAELEAEMDFLHNLMLRAKPAQQVRSADTPFPDFSDSASPSTSLADPWAFSSACDRC